jgi:hypothetical protein
MSTKPTPVVEWAESGTVVEPSSGKKATGWTFQERPASSFMNWILRTVGRWTSYINAVFADRGTTPGYIGTVAANPSDACLTLGSSGGLVITQDDVSGHVLRHYTSSGAPTTLRSDRLIVAEGISLFKSTRVESTQPNPAVDVVFVDFYDDDPTFGTVVRSDEVHAGSFLASDGLARLQSLNLANAVVSGLNRLKVTEAGGGPSFVEAEFYRAIDEPPSALVGDAVLGLRNVVRVAGVFWNDTATSTITLSPQCYNVASVSSIATGQYTVTFTNSIPCVALGGTLFPVGLTASVGWQPGYIATGNQYAVQLGPCSGAVGAATSVSLTVFNTTTGAAVNLPLSHFVSFVVV